MNMRVVFILSHSPDPRMIRRMNSFFKITNDISVVFWNRSFNLPIPQGIQVKSIEAHDSWNIFGRIFSDLKLFFASLKYLLSKNPTIIYVSGADMVPVGYFYKIFYRDVKLVLEIADLPGGRFSNRKWIKYLNNLVNKMIKKADLLVLTSTYFWERYYKNLYPFNERVFIMENLPPRRLFQNFKHIKHKKLVIGFVGVIRYGKQIANLFETCKDYEENVEIIVAGSGPDLRYIESISKNYKNVKITGPYDYEKDILDIYSKIDIVYSVYDADDFNVRLAIPNRFYEAVVCGLPIIVAKNTALSWLVKEYGVGFEVSHSDVNELKNLIKNILDNPVLLERCRGNALKIRENFYYENAEEKFINKITGLIKIVKDSSISNKKYDKDEKL